MAIRALSRTLNRSGNITVLFETSPRMIYKNTSKLDIREAAKSNHEIMSSTGHGLQSSSSNKSAMI